MEENWFSSKRRKGYLGGACLALAMLVSGIACQKSDTTATTTADYTDPRSMAAVVALLDANVGDDVLFGHYPQSGRDAAALGTSPNSPASDDRAQTQANAPQTQAQPPQAQPPQTQTQSLSAESGWLPIRWRLLKKSNGLGLLLAESGLDAMCYDREFRESTWASSTIRRWLNHDFLETAFNDQEEGRIVTTHLENDDNPYTNAPGGPDTEDRVFLLSIDDVDDIGELFFANDRERLVRPTAVARAHGAEVSDYGIGWWWLRSPGSVGTKAMTIAFSGSVSAPEYRTVTDSSGCVRPSLWITLRP